MFTAGVVFAVLAGIQLFFMVLRLVAIKCGRKLLAYSEANPFLRHEMAEKSADLKDMLDRTEKISSSGSQIAALVFLAISIVFFYFQ